MVAAYATVGRETPPRSRSFFMACRLANGTLDHAWVLLSELNGVICLRALKRRSFSSNRSTYSTEVPVSQLTVALINPQLAKHVIKVDHSRPVRKDYILKLWMNPEREGPERLRSRILVSGCLSV